MTKQPVVLMILDGWGIRQACNDNAVTLANPQHFYDLLDKYPHTQLNCSGLDVGLPAGLMGNSEVGHLNMGAGRIVYQEITRISNAIANGSFFNNHEFINAMEYARGNKGAVHLMGLLSEGGVHSSLEHLYALLKLCRMHQIKKVYIHAFLDGRDVGPKSAREFISAVQKHLDDIGAGQIATIGGRFYGMDRDNRWERIEPAYNAMVMGEGIKAPNPYAAIERSYEARLTDEFVEPVVIVDDKGEALGRVNDGDCLIFFNFRADRARQITRAFVDPQMDKFVRKKQPHIYYVCLTQYDKTIPAPVAFPPQNLSNTLGAVLAAHNLKQLRIAETEKYAHVTFFFNGGVEEPNPGEERVLIPSPKVATYNLQPEMSALEVTSRVVQELSRDYYDVIIMNYANADMLGHTGILEAAVKAIHTVDEGLQKVVDAALQKGGSIVITADHGNAEMMRCPQTGGPFTAHTTDQVPFILVSEKYRQARLRDDAALCDIAPTLLNMLEVSIPQEMTGRPILL